MPHIIIGPGAENVLTNISRNLRIRTLELSCQLDGRAYAHYSPWMAGRPLWARPAPAALLAAPRTMCGAVITDVVYLSAITEFLNEHPELLVELIGSRSDWAIAERVDEDRPGMVEELLEALAEIVSRSSFFGATKTALIEWIVPLRQERPRGWSLQSARGLVFLGFHRGYDRTDLALDIVHEMGHQALALFQSVDPIFESDPQGLVYSEVRKTHRPAIQSLHAASAIAFMTQYLNDVDRLDHIHPDFTKPMPDVLADALQSLDSHCVFTPIGAQIVTDFRRLAK